MSWMEGAVGHKLSGLTLSLPEWLPKVYIALLVLSGIHLDQGGPGLRGRERCAFCVVALAVSGLIMLSMLLLWTNDASNVIVGIQGRYFIPILPLVFLLLNGDSLVLKKSIDQALMMMGGLLNIAAIILIVRYTMLNA